MTITACSAGSSSKNDAGTGLVNDGAIGAPIPDSGGVDQDDGGIFIPGQDAGTVVDAGTLLPTQDAGSSNTSDGGIVFPSQDAGSSSIICNPVQQTGCAINEKCTNVFEDIGGQIVSRTTCVPDGSIAVGQACLIANDIDPCSAGSLCIGEVCTEICDVPSNSCGADQVCVRYANIFPEFEGVGLCDSACDAVTQTVIQNGAPSADVCPNNNACYYSPALASGVCSIVPTPAINLLQDDACYGPSSNSCYLNGCDQGFGSFYQDANATPVCSAYCRPIETSSSSSAGALGDLSVANCGDPGVLSGGAASYQCRFLGSDLGDSIGTCVAVDDVWGDCTQFDRAAFIEAFNGDGVNDDENYCLVNSDPNGDFDSQRCPGGCLSNATLDSLFN